MGVTSTLAQSRCWARKSISSAVEICSTCTRRRNFSASATSRRVASSAASGSRHSGCRGRIALSTHVLARDQSRFIFRVERRPSARRRDNPLQRRVIVNQQVARRRPHEHLDPGRGLQAVPVPGSRPRSRACRPRRRRKSHNMRSRAAVTFSASVSAVVVSGTVFGISNTSRHTAEDSRPAAGFEVFLMRHTRARENAPGCRSRRAGRAGR